MPSKKETVTIKINRDRHGPTLRAGVNGRRFLITTGQNYEADPLLVESLRNSGVSFEEVSEGAASKEGSGGAAPEDTPPAMLPRTLDDSRGDQPGDVTTATSNATDASGRLSLEELARISDIRVAAERRVERDASIAARAGEGEGGTEAVEDNPFDHNGDGKPGGAPKGGNRKKK